MKYLLSIYILCANLEAISQTPYLWVRFKMDSIQSSSSSYTIKMKICDLANPSDKGDWLTADTSGTDFNTLHAKDIICQDYRASYEGVEYLSGEKPVVKDSEFEYSNQTFAFEKILVFKIVNESSARILPPMYIVFPVRYKSFATGIRINGVVFDDGKAILVENTDAKREGMSILLETSLLDRKGVNVKDFRLKEIL